MNKRILLIAIFIFIILPISIFALDWDQSTNTLIENLFSFTEMNILYPNLALVNQSNTFAGNVYVEGNFSAELPHLTGYDNTTQVFLTLETAQAINLSNNYASHQIEIIDNTNITFERAGHYQICISPEFYQASGINKWITFWLQENGVDVPWSNSRYTMDNGEYTAPHICWETMISTPATDNIRIMWLSDSTASRIVSITGLTSPTRPGIPGIIMDVTWVSNGM